MNLAVQANASQTVAGAIGGRQEFKIDVMGPIIFCLVTAAQ